MAKLTQEIINFIVDTKDSNSEITYQNIADEIKSNFGIDTNKQAVGRAYRAFKNKSDTVENEPKQKAQAETKTAKEETKKPTAEKAEVKPKKKRTTDKNKITLTIQVDKNIAEQFKRIAKENDRNQSQLIREWIKKYCRENGQAKLF